MSRAVGETMIVLLAAGGTPNAAFDPGARALTLLWKDGPPIDELRLIVFPTVVGPRYIPGALLPRRDRGRPNGNGRRTTDGCGDPN